METLRQRKQTEEIQNEDWSSEDITKLEPCAIQIVIANEDHTFSLNEEALSKVLMHDDIKDRYVVVVSVTGTFRQGKSFMLNFFLKYMVSKYIFKEDKGDWLGIETVPLDGFSWRGGSERNTTGILMWSEIFLTEMLTGEKVAIIFLDTQGAFDCESTVKECAVIFALSTMVSSVQIYNLSQDIHEYDLHYLQYFTEYGRLAMDNTGDTPFQKLQFLVRDWKFPYDNEYGAEGGKKLLDRRLKLKDHQHRDLQDLRQHIRSCFSEISCFLMPHPGLIVANCPTFNRKLSDINSEFKENLQVLVPNILAPENLVLKKIYGQRIKACDLVQYFKSYIQIYHGNELPEPKTLFAATAKANNLSAISKAKRVYIEFMKEACCSTKPYLSMEEMEAVHKKAMQEALHKFRNKKKMGGDLYSKKYEESLKKDLLETFEQFESVNESKNTIGIMVRRVITTCLNFGCLGWTGFFCRCLLGGAFGAAFSFATLAAACVIISDGVRQLSVPKNRRLVMNLLKHPHLIWEDYMKRYAVDLKEKIKEMVMPRRPTSAPNHKPHQS